MPILQAHDDDRDWNAFSRLVNTRLHDLIFTQIIVKPEPNGLKAVTPLN